MKKKILLLTAIAGLAIGGTIFGFTYKKDCPLAGTPECSAYQNCPKKGQADCPIVQNCPKKGTDKCPYKDEKPSCCQKNKADK